MPAGNFDDKLTVAKDGIVKATGPLDPSVKGVTELCVWVLQRNGTNDAFANAMGKPSMAGMPGMPGMPEMDGGLTVEGLGTPDARWTFPLTNRFKKVDFRAGSATASAFGVFVDDKGRQRAFFWSEPVRLAGPGAPRA
ncbi:MAG: hypothetical protein QOC86_1189 [Gaiellales bacterium]|nr:hypothetical protein [Gaiellales bacterium]